MKKHIFNIPILLVIYKRADTLREVIKSLRVGKPRQIYCVGDGAKGNFELDQVNQTRKILNQIDWPCHIEIQLNKTNRGLKYTIESGLDWVLAKEKYVTVIEDDIIVSASFFPFMEYALKKYINVPQIAGVAGYNPFSAGSENSYHFSRYHRSWGWSVYARSWEHKIMPNGKITGLRLALRTYFHLISRLTALGKLDTWDYRWTLANLSNNTLFVVPNRNLVTNIGDGNSATHTRVIPKSLLPPLEELTFPPVDPPKVVADSGIDHKLANLVYLNYRSVLGAIKTFLWR